MAQGYTRTSRKNISHFIIAFFALFLATASLYVTPISSYAATSSTHWVFVKVKPGDTLYSIFRAQKISPKTLASILKLPAASTPLKRLHVNQIIRFGLDRQNNLQSFALSLGKSQTLTVFRGGSRYIARIEKGSFRIPVTVKNSTPPKTPSKPITKPIVKTKPVIIKPVKKITPSPAQQKKPAVVTKTSSVKKAVLPIEKSVKKVVVAPPKKVTPAYPSVHYTGLLIHSSLYNDAKRYGIPYKIINQLTQIFALQVNFKDVHPGDKLLLAYDDAYSKGRKIGPGNILAVKFIQKNRVYAAVRYVNAQGVVEYFSPQGESMKKAFNRFPVKYTHINSLFNMHRMHPVTHVIRPHTGVDLAAPLGTPIYSIGDGKINFIGWEGEYGNIVKVQHNDKYSSMYAHMLRFAPGLSVGSYVKRGQLIGFLGQTGNATGPHVHFEIRIYNVPVNPLTVPLPQATAVPPSQLGTFRAKSKLWMAALDNYQRTQLK